MTNPNPSPMNRLLSLALSLSKMPPVPDQIFVALIYGVFCQTVLPLAVSVMVFAMFFGMAESFGDSIKTLVIRN